MLTPVEPSRNFMSRATQVPGKLAPDFRFLWQFNGDLDRAGYLAEGKGPYTTLRTALPDLFWNAYDFRVDKYESKRVWATTRLTGTHTGPLVFDGKEYPASGTRVESAPECVSFVFDEETGLCTKMTGGFCLDRGVGNTGPAGSIWGVMQAIGESVSVWKYFPPVKVLGDIVGPTFRPKKSLGMARSPFRDAVAIALAKQVLTLGAEDLTTLEGLLADDLQVYAPILGPFKKKQYLQSLCDLKDFNGNLSFDVNFYDARVDPVEPSRVWLTARSTVKVIGPLQAFGNKFEPKRESYQDGPETFSVVFDEDGYVSKITLGCVMDTELGEADGLGNFFGILSGLGIPAPDVFVRPAPESFRRLVSSLTPQRMKTKPQAKRATKPTVAVETPPALADGVPAGSPKAAAPKVKAPVKPNVKPGAPDTTLKVPPKAAPKAAPKVTPSPAKAAAGKAPPTKVASAKAKATTTSPPERPAKAATPPKASKPAPAATRAATPKKSVSPPAKESAGSKPTAASPAKAPALVSQGLFGFGRRESKPTAAVDREVEAKTAGSRRSKQARSAPASAPASSSSSSRAEKPTAEPKKQKVAPPAAPAPSAPTKVAVVVFSAQLLQKLEAAAGSAQAVSQLYKRTELFAKGGISAMDYWGTLKKLSAIAYCGTGIWAVVGKIPNNALKIRTRCYYTVKTLAPDALQNLGPDIIGSLPPGNQKSALFKIYSTGTT